MSVALHHGDCRDVLATLPAESVQCCVTSPPYFGLRDYGTARWEGGDPACEHGVNRWDGPKQTQGAMSGHASAADRLARRQCRCGAVRVDSQIGLEQSPQEYVAQLVAVFREVRRVLRPDGICFLNLGDSYCSANQEKLYSLREDCTLKELQNVALAMFGVRIDGYGSAGQGPLPEVLPIGIQSKEIRLESAVESGGVKEELSAASRGCDSSLNSAASSNEDRCAHRSGREMRLLRGDNPGVSDSRSHSRRRRSTSETVDGQEQIVVDQDLPRGKAPRLPEGSLSRPVLQLQLRDRVMGLLSARQFARHEIPSSVRACFKASANVKPKDLLLIPARVALALQSDGWFLRSEIIWAKSSPMPESVRDRPTCAHEKVWLLTKAASYFYDADAVAEPALTVGDTRHLRTDLTKTNARPDNGSRERTGNPQAETRNLRNVWHLNPEPFPGAHFATMPPTLAERCIKAGTSEKGQCPHCGSPWVRVVERTPATVMAPASEYGNGAGRNDGNRSGLVGAGSLTLGWSPSCSCPAHEPVPQTVLDPFAGAGTTLLVADRLQRHGIGIELNPEYIAIAQDRLRGDAPLFAEVA